jgi:hypothetical protein
MTWYKVDDGLPTHRKVLAIPRGTRRLQAIGAWTLIGAWCAAERTEGRVPAAIVSEFGIPTKVTADLLSVGLWHKTDGGFEIHDYLDYNPTAEQIEADRVATRERQRRAREKSRVSRVSNAVTDAVTNASVTPPVTVPPSRPDPTRSSSASVVKETLPPLQREPESALAAWAETERGRTWEDELKLELERFYGCEYPWSWVTRTIELTVGNREVKDPIAYVMTAVANDRARFGPANVPRVLLPNLALGDLPK